ncbi:MAG: NYN domain-containing protein [Acidimicrobiaceae bacterium]|nr:NYN domain-containing protein [Acidimicrobiaceae bacterium]
MSGVGFIHHPYRFDGRVEAVLRGGLCLSADILAEAAVLITNLYIDGFNLYYRALKDTPFRWLDLHKLAVTLFPDDTIRSVNYFTARLESRAGNLGQAQRQLIYLRALSTLPDVRIHYGYFRSGVKRRPLAKPLPGLPSHVLVRNSEEKGSDVNLATRLLVEGFNAEHEQAVVMSNDADFAGAMCYVRDGLGLRVVLVNPDSNNASPEQLKGSATYERRLWRSHLKRSQFRDSLTDEFGTISKPAGW